MVLAGDLLDPLMAGPRARVFLNEQFHRLAERGIKVYWSGGRSDNLERFADEWPAVDGVLRFASHRVERVVHQRDGQPLVQILGTSSQQRKKIRSADYRTDGTDLFAVAVAYGSTDAEMLAQHAVNYWALGGEHDRRAVLNGPAVAHYCGTPQGRRPQESGPHGCTLVQVDETQRVRTSFIPTDAVRFHAERVTVSESATGEQLQQVLTERSGELLGDPFGPDLLIQWIVSGSKSLSAELRRGKLAADLTARLRTDHGQKRPAGWTVSIEADAGGVQEDRYEEETLLGEFLRTVRHYVENPDDKLDLAPYLAERHVVGSVGSAVTLDEPAVRARVLAEVARLGLELLVPEEPRS